MKRGRRAALNRRLREKLPGAETMLAVLEHVHCAREKTGLTVANYEAILAEIENGLILARDEMCDALVPPRKPKA